MYLPEDRTSYEQIMGKAIFDAFEYDVEFRGNLNKINEKFRSLIKTKKDGFVLDSRFNSWLVAAYQVAKLSENAYQVFISLADEHEPAEMPFIRLNQIVSPMVIFNLHHAYENIKESKRVKTILGDKVCTAIVLEFDTLFPNLVSARHALAHEGQRASGERGKTSILKKPSFPMATSCGIANLVDKRGNKIPPFGSSVSIAQLVSNLQKNVFGKL